MAATVWGSRRYTRGMRIAVGSDHAGFELKAALAKHLVDGGHEVIDLGTDSPDISVDYPEFGFSVARAVAEGRVEGGLCVCGTGIGISIAANKVRGVRAALAHDVTTASLARRHNDANVVCLGGRTTGLAEAVDIADTFFGSMYDGGRHQRRIDAITQYENGQYANGQYANGQYERDHAGAGPAPADDHERQ